MKHSRDQIQDGNMSDRCMNPIEKFPAGGLKAYSVPRRTFVMNLENIL